jgi:hypothetical protein
MAKLKDMMTYRWSQPLLWGSGAALFLLLTLGLLWVQPGSILQAAENAIHETLNLTIGTLPAGKNMVLTFDVTVGSLPPGATQISNQGEVSGSNFATVLTDDPTLPGASDPTIIAADPLPDAGFTLSKTVGIDGITPTCTAQGTLKVPVNTTVVYCYTVHNTGAVALIRHTLVDSHLGTLLDDMAFAVAPGATFSHTATATVAVDTTNVATWTAIADDGAGAAAVDAIDAVTTTVDASAVVIISAAGDDQDADTIPDNIETAEDVDGDNLPNFLDTNSDGDAVLDRDEVGPDPNNPQDTDGDGVPDFLDPDTPSSLDPDEQPQVPDQRPRIFIPRLND